MRNERLLQVLRAPVVSEKASRVAENNQYVFKVSRDATKADVKAAVEMVFDVKVNDVHVVNMPGKARRFRNINGKRPSWKKAYVTLAEGQSIDFGISA